MQMIMIRIRVTDAPTWCKRPTGVTADCERIYTTSDFCVKNETKDTKGKVANP